MKITTLWRKSNVDDPDEMPWLIVAYDEYTEEEHGGEPEFYTKERRDGDRQLVVSIPDVEVSRLFAVPTVKGKVQS